MDAQIRQQHLAAIVEGSDDAIITKNLDSIIQSWNPGAERLFGYSADEAVGQPITMLFPADRMDEEVDFIARLSRGERIAHFETVRKRKDGTLVPISLTVSPMRNADGKIIGASKIARDITLKREVEERQRLLLAEMRHRVGNSYAVASGLLAVAARHSNNVAELVAVMRQRLHALAQVHSRTVTHPSGAEPEGTSLFELVNSIVEPFTGELSAKLELPEVDICPAAITPLSLLIFELATNAVKYGGLSGSGKGISVHAERFDDRLLIRWKEACISTPACSDPSYAGFGTHMSQSAVSSSLGGTFAREFSPQGMTATIDLNWSSVTGT